MSTSSKATRDAENGNYSPPRESSGLERVAACLVCPPLILLEAADALTSKESIESRRQEYDETYRRVRDNMND